MPWMSSWSPISVSFGRRASAALISLRQTKFAVVSSRRFAGSARRHFCMAASTAARSAASSSASGLMSRNASVTSGGSDGGKSAISGWPRRLRPARPFTTSTTCARNASGAKAETVA